MNSVIENPEYSLSLLKDIISRALDTLPATRPGPRHGMLTLPSRRPLFLSAWIEVAGLDHKSELNAIRPNISQLLCISDLIRLHVTNYGALLFTGISPRVAESSIPIDTGIVFITGTGSLACGYRLLPNNDSPIPVPVDRGATFSVMKHPLITSAKPRKRLGITIAFHVRNCRHEPKIKDRVFMSHSS